MLVFVVVLALTARWAAADPVASERGCTSQDGQVEDELGRAIDDEHSDDPESADPESADIASADLASADTESADLESADLDQDDDEPGVRKPDADDEPRLEVLGVSTAIEASLEPFARFDDVDTHGLEEREAALRRGRSLLGRIDLSLTWRRHLAASGDLTGRRDEVWLVGTWRL